MTRDPLLTDLGIAVLAGILILVLTPGVAVAGLIAVLVLAGFTANLILDSRRRRRPARPRRSTSGSRRPPQGGAARTGR